MGLLDLFRWHIQDHILNMLPQGGTEHPNCLLEMPDIISRFFIFNLIFFQYIFYQRPVDLWAVGCMIPEMVDTNPLYPGSSDVDQLYQIVRSCGELCIRHKQLIKKNPAFVGWKWPRQKERYMIERRIRNKVNTIY